MATVNMSVDQLANTVNRLENVATKLETLAHQRPGSGHSSSSSRDEVQQSQSVLEFDELLEKHLSEYTTLSSEIGGVVKEQAALVNDAYTAERDLLETASRSKKPPQDSFQNLLKPIASTITAVQEFREKNRGSEYFNHLSAISESITAVGWLTSDAPAPYIKDMSDSGQFYLNRVLKDWKPKSQIHADWVKSIQNLHGALHSYVKKTHTTGLTWNAKGGDAMSQSARTVGAPPPPPPPPPPPAVTAVETQSSEDSDGRAALLSELNKGTDITKSLKKVSDDMKTHKNPALRQGPAPYKPVTGPKPFQSVKPHHKSVEAAKPPVLELQGKKWVVEYQQGQRMLSITDTIPKQSVYIYKCQDSVLQIKGKINSITVDNCKKTAIVVDDVISCVEFVNSQSVQCQVNGKISTVSIDKTDGCQVYLSDQSKEAEIVTAKSSEMNILIPSGDGDFKEFPLPEQFKTVWNGSKMVTVPTEIS